MILIALAGAQFFMPFGRADAPRPASAIPEGAKIARAKAAKQAADEHAQVVAGHAYDAKTIRCFIAQSKPKFHPNPKDDREKLENNYYMSMLSWIAYQPDASATALIHELGEATGAKLRVKFINKQNDGKYTLPCGTPTKLQASTQAIFVEGPDFTTAVFRGTSNSELETRKKGFDLKTDLNTKSVDIKGFEENLQARRGGKSGDHAVYSPNGFFGGAMLAWDDIHDEMVKSGNKPMFPTGHSMGAGEAVDFATWLLNDRARYKAWSVEMKNKPKSQYTTGDQRKIQADFARVMDGGPVTGLYAIAPPRTGDVNFKELQEGLYAEDPEFQHYAWKNYRDFVPDVSPFDPFPKFERLLKGKNPWVGYQTQVNCAIGKTGELYVGKDQVKGRVPLSLGSTILTPLLGLKNHNVGSYTFRFGYALGHDLTGCMNEQWLKEVPLK
jgi:hypothetical protein